jgi:acyl-coenzyme A thioesterase PaaI-like protein
LTYNIRSFLTGTTGNPKKGGHLLALQLVKDRRCFVCGAENPDGLKITVEQAGAGRVRAEFLAEERYRGWSDYLHGGVLTLIFDEMLGWLSRYLGHDAMTARLEVRYRKPVPLGSRLTFSGVLERQVKNLLDIRLSADLEDGSTAAEASGRMMIIGRSK